MSAFLYKHGDFLTILLFLVPWVLAYLLPWVERRTGRPCCRFMQGGAPSRSRYNLGGPNVNVDGTPMVGNIDIRGRPYGITNRD